MKDFSHHTRNKIWYCEEKKHVTSKNVGIGEVSLIIENRNKLVLNEVWHVLNMHLNGESIILLLYAHDMLIVGKNKKNLGEVKKA